MLRVLRFDSLDACAHLREQVDALNLRARRPCPYSTFEYLENFIAHDELFDEGTTARVLFLAVMDDDRLVGYVALRRRFILQLGREPAKVEWLVIRDTDRPHLVSAPEDEARCARAIVEHLVNHERHWSYLEFADQEADSPLVAALEDIASARYVLHRVAGHENSTIELDGCDRETYFRKMSHKRREHLSRIVRHFLDVGNVELIENEDDAAGRAMLGVYLAIERESWKGRAHVGIGRHAKRIAFYEGLFDPAQPLRVKVSVLAVGGVPVAGFIRGHFAGAAFAVEVVYDERFERSSPGQVLFFLTLMREIAAGARTFNLRNDSAYWKTKFLAATESTSHVRFYRRASLAYLQGLAGTVRRALLARHDAAAWNPVKREVEAEPHVESAMPTNGVGAAALAAVLTSGASLTRLDAGQLAALCPWKTRQSTSKMRAATATVS